MAFGGVAYGSWPLGGKGGGPTPGTFRLFIAGTDVTSLLSYQGHSVEQVLNARGTAKATLRFVGSSFVPAAGNRFTMKIDTTIVFDGYIHSVVRSHLVESNTASFLYQIKAVDWNAFCDRRIVNQVYTNMTCGAIVLDILSTVLAAEGVVQGTILDGPTVTKVVFPRMKASDCFRDLSKKSGYVWRIDEYKQLHFFRSATFPAPFAIDSSNALFYDLTIDKSLDNYANKIYVQAGRGVTATQTERLVGDGKTQSWPVAYPVNEAPTGVIETNGIPTSVVTFGVRQKEANKQFYWQRDDNTINSDTALILAAGEVLVVSYKGLYPLTLLLQSEGAIAERAAAQGGSGLYELSEVKDNIDGEDAVVEFGLADLRKYGVLPERVKFTTHEERLYPGHSVSVSVPTLGLSGTYIVSRVKFTQYEKGVREYSVECALSEKYDELAEYLAADEAAGKPLVIRENEVISDPVGDDEPVLVTDGGSTADLVTENGFLKWDGSKRWNSSQWAGP
jgi:hypothetical protein